MKKRNNKKNKSDFTLLDIIMVLKGLLSALLVFSVSFIALPTAQASWINEKTTPTEVLNYIVDGANKNSSTRVQNTKFDQINNREASVGGTQFKITSTLAWIKANIQHYLQWVVFIGLIGATILLIRNGFRLVTNSAIGGWDIKTIKSNIKNILIGVVVMTSFLVIIKLVSALLNMFFSQ